ncbi:MAG TPA: 16S rRNA (adenine(1518)-N(6)/adenine(1519)-N(6))-dimethyltransferase RsmA [Micropepsaceae bacterium]|nr:16S rRNA (adenine(1518)-N(6)/adenine(1519)-N(6))-dimethyltransferase RsmA [Micropepsaceae bacterium]
MTQHGVSEDGLPPLRAVIAAHGLTPKRSLGQNFIFDLNLTRRIAREAKVAEAAVYEVGPGPGGLTRALLAEGAARVIAVERDARALPALNDIAAAKPGRLEVVQADALELDERALLSNLGVTQPVPVVANLPFNVGTAILIKWLSTDWPPWWQSLTLMFQKEVAERICAEPGDDAYGRLSVLASWRTRARILFDVSRSAFVPPPNVTSAVIRIEPLPAPRYEAELGDLEAVTAAAFGQRRKMLRGSLKSLTQDAEALLEAAGVPGTARAEELNLAQFCALARALARKSQSLP